MAKIKDAENTIFMELLKLMEATHYKKKWISIQISLNQKCLSDIVLMETEI